MCIHVCNRFVSAKFDQSRGLGGTWECGGDRKEVFGGQRRERDEHSWGQEGRDWGQGPDLALMADPNPVLGQPGTVPSCSNFATS